MVSHKQVLEAVSFVKEAVEAWRQADETPLVEFRGTHRKAISQEVEQVAAALFELTDTGDVEDTLACRRIVLAVDDFERAFMDWAEEIERKPDATDPSGNVAIWSAYQAVLDAALPLHSSPPPDPVAMAKLKGMLPVQIAKTLGWKMPNGQPDIGKVIEELDNPGRHYDPEKWIDPKQVRLAAAVSVAWDQRKARQRESDKTGRRDRRDDSAPPRAAPESLDDMIAAGVRSDQLVKYHFKQPDGRLVKMTKQQIAARAEELGLPLDGSLVSPFFKKTADQEEEDRIEAQAEEMRLAAIDVHDELGDDVKARALAMLQDGTSPGDIALALTATGKFPRGVTAQKIVKYREEAATLAPQV